MMHEETKVLLRVNFVRKCLGELKVDGQDLHFYRLYKYQVCKRGNDEELQNHVSTSIFEPAHEKRVLIT